VARDVAGFRLGGFRVGGAGIYMPTSTDAVGTTLLARVRGDAEPARRSLSDRLAAIDPSISQVGTLDTIANTETYILGISFWLTLVLGALALLLTLSGLFSVLSYLVEQRTREIGVRMALGASSRSIGGLVLRQSARPVGIGLGVGAALAAGLGGLLLSTPLAEQIGSTVLLFDPLAYAGSMLFVIAACALAALMPALRAGRVNPLAALRQD
jgi:ABC-type antimicrobial peptide transport system permease subunit